MLKKFGLKPEEVDKLDAIFVDELLIIDDKVEELKAKNMIE